MCVIYRKTFNEDRKAQWTEYRRTEVIFDTVDPDFVTKVVTEYSFEQDQFLRFEIYDMDSDSPNLDHHDFIGLAECKLAQIVSAGHKHIKLPLLQEKQINYQAQPPGNRLRDGQYKGEIILSFEELTDSKEEVTLKLDGRLMGAWLFGYVVPTVFYVVSKVNESGSYTVVYRSESLRNDNPSWKAKTFTMQSLCNNDKDRGLKIQCFKEGYIGYHRLIGTIQTTVNLLLRQVGQDGVHLLDRENHILPANLIMSQVQISPIYTFIDFISTGTQIHCCFAIDFTASNGPPSEPSSLHYYGDPQNQSNPYEQAIQSVGEIIQEYNSSHMFPVFGFGAKLPPNGNISHYFPVTLAHSPYCEGISGVLEAYRNCIRQVQLYGPTNFASIIREAAVIAGAHMEGMHYHILLIITDGVISDMAATKEAIVNASTLLLSILIVGVGGADFTSMEELDGDQVRLSSNGVIADRDIVQFVPFRDALTWNSTRNHSTPAYSKRNFNTIAEIAKAQLAKEVLAEIPNQVVSFMKTSNLKPKQSLN